MNCMLYGVPRPHAPKSETRTPHPATRGLTIDPMLQAGGRGQASRAGEGLTPGYYERSQGPVPFAPETSNCYDTTTSSTHRTSRHRTYQAVHTPARALV